MEKISRLKYFKKSILLFALLPILFLSGCQSINFKLIDLPIKWESSSFAESKIIKTYEEFTNFINNDNFVKKDDSSALAAYNEQYFQNNAVLAIADRYEAVIKTVTISEDCITVKIKDKYLNKATPDIYYNDFSFIEISNLKLTNVSKINVKFI